MHVVSANAYTQPDSSVSLVSDIGARPYAMQTAMNITSCMHEIRTVQMGQKVGRDSITSWRVGLASLWRRSPAGGLVMDRCYV